MSLTVIVLAAGSGDRWGNLNGIPKHLIEIEGETLLHRTVRLFQGADRLVVNGPYKADALSDGMLRAEFVAMPQEEDVGDAAKYLCVAPLWNRLGRTLILYGDVYYSVACATSMLEHEGLAWHLWARWGPSTITGKKYAESFGHSFGPLEHDRHYGHLRAVVNLWKTAGWPRCGTWETYRFRHDRPFSYLQSSCGDDTTTIDDWTEDYDNPSDLQEWLRRRDMRPML